MEHTHYVILLEQPSVPGRCLCGAWVKSGNTHTGESIMIEPPYLVSMIFRIDGRFFEVIRERFQHRCPLTASPENAPTNQLIAAAA